MCLAWWSHCNAAYVFLKKLCFAKECIKIVKPCCTLFSLVFGMQLPEQKRQGKQSGGCEYSHLLLVGGLWAPFWATGSQSSFGQLCQEVHSGILVTEAHCCSVQWTNQVTKWISPLWNSATVTLLYVIKFLTSGFSLEILAKGRPAWVR